jgi:hypothetical protein
MYAFHVIEHVISTNGLGSARESVSLLVFPFRSLEMNESGLYEITNALRYMMLRTWWRIN